jgi:predicted dehydrogenase
MRAIVIGLGRMGENHLRALKNLNIDVVAVCDSRATDTFGDALNELIENVTVFSSVQSLVESNLIFDLAIIATTTPGRESVVDLLLQSKVTHILCEKPLSTSTQSAHRIVEKCLASNVKLAVNHQMRFMPQYEMIQKLARNNNLGELRSMIVSAANIGLGMNVTHYIEAFNWLTESPLSHVSSRLEIEPIGNPRGVQFEDRAGYLTGYNPKGQRLYVDFSSDIGHHIYVTYNFKTAKIFVNELEGTIMMDSRSQDFLEFPTSRYGCENIISEFEIAPASSTEPTQRLIETFCRGGNYPTGESGFLTVACAIASITSSQSGSQFVLITEESSIEVDWA